MCLGIPMQVLEMQGTARAICSCGKETRIVDFSLIGPVETGQWVMTFLGVARQAITAETARQARDALQAVELAMRGETDLDHLFADLVGRQPTLPEGLRPPGQDRARK